MLVEIAESWRAFSGINFRCCMEESTQESKIDLSSAMPCADDEEEEEDNDDELNFRSLSRKQAVAVTWAALVQTAAAHLPATGEETLQRIVKDALDYGVTQAELTAPSPWCEEDGPARLAALLSEPARGALRALPSRIQPVKQWRAIDRRFDGPKHRRTRDFGRDDGCAQQ